MTVAFVANTALSAGYALLAPRGNKISQQAAVAQALAYTAASFLISQTSDKPTTSLNNCLIIGGSVVIAGAVNLLPWKLNLITTLFFVAMHYAVSLATAPNKLPSPPQILRPDFASTTLDDLLTNSKYTPRVEELKREGLVSEYQSTKRVAQPNYFNDQRVLNALEQILKMLICGQIDPKTKHHLTHSQKDNIFEFPGDEDFKSSLPENNSNETDRLFLGLGEDNQPWVIAEHQVSNQGDKKYLTLLARESGAGKLKIQYEWIVQNNNNLNIGNKSKHFNVETLQKAERVKMLLKGTEIEPYAHLLTLLFYGTLDPRAISKQT